MLKKFVVDLVAGIPQDQLLKFSVTIRSIFSTHKFSQKSIFRLLVCFSSPLPFIRLARNTRTNPLVGHLGFTPHLLPICRQLWPSFSSVWNIYLPSLCLLAGHRFTELTPFRAEKELTEKATCV